MSSQSNPVIAPPRVVVKAKPGEIPEVVEIDLGGILEFQNNLDDYPDFEIQFINTSPPDPHDRLTGTVGDPILIHMPGTEAFYKFQIVYKQKDGKRRCIEEINFARSCPGCPPNNG